MISVTVTGRQLEVFRFLASFIKDKGYPPTRVEISEHFGFNSCNAADSVLRALARKGAIEITPHIARGITLLAEPPKKRKGGI